MPYSHTETYTCSQRNGKAVIITGSGRANGSAIAQHLSRLSVNVIVNYANSTKDTNKIVAQIKALCSDAITVKTNASEVPQIVKTFDNTVAHSGQPDITVSKSGIVSFGYWKDLTEEKLSQVSMLLNNSSYCEKHTPTSMRADAAPELHAIFPRIPV